MSQRTQHRKVITIITAALFLAVLIGTITAGTAASVLYNNGNSDAGFVALISGLAFAILAIAAGWTLFYRLGGLIADYRRSKVK